MSSNPTSEGSESESDELTIFTPEELKNIATTTINELIPTKSKERYEMAYKDFLKWQKSKKNKSFSENAAELGQTMKEETFLSNEDFIKRQKLIKSRQQRLIQTRVESKRIAASLLERAKCNANREYQEMENRVLAEIRQHYSQELASVRQHYENCITEINKQHYVKLVGVQESEKRKNTDLRKIVRTVKYPPLGDKNSSETKKNKDDDKLQSQKENILNGKRCCKSVHKKPVTSVSEKKPKILTKKEKLVKGLPENIIIDSDNVNHENVSFSENDNFVGSSVVSSSTCPKRTVVFHSPTNCDVSSTCADVLKKTLPNLRKQTKCVWNPNIVQHADHNVNHTNAFDPKSILKYMPEQQYTNEIYNQLVHDRIRMLEQKEKILSKRTPEVDLVSVAPPSRFSHYFTSVHTQSSSDRPKQPEDPNKPNDINCDFNRVEMKKKLLTLELANAGTQTEPRIKSQSTSSQTSDSLSQSTPNNKVDNRVSELKQDELVCPSPIPKQDNETFKRSRRCKRKQSRVGKALVVTVVNNKTKISTNGTETDSSNSYAAQSSIDHDKISVENGRTVKSVNIIVNVLSNATNIDRLAHKSREAAHITNDANLEKTSQWRRLFENEEKLTESSYFSPPEAVSTHKRAETEISKPPKNIDYYIRKLLLMSPESVENLNVSSCNSTQVQEIEKNTEHKKKIPVSIPLYQNSFEDTMDVVFDVSSDRNNSTLMKEHSFRTDESDDSSASVYLRKYTSSLSDSSIQEPDVDKTIDEIPQNFDENENVRHESTADDSDEDNVELPSLDELLRRGFTWKPVIKTKMDEEIDTLEEEEFIKEMLKVSIQPDDEKVEESECLESSDDQDVATLSKAKNSLLSKNESRLFGWIGATVQRTLEASAMNSTSSGEGSDPFRKMHKTLEHLVEEQQSLAPTNENFSISPIKAPDIHLDVPIAFEKNTTKE